MRLGLVGIFDMGDFEGAAVRRVVESGLRRRLPGADVIAFSPLGPAHPTVRDGGDPPRALPLPEGLDAVVAAGPLPDGVPGDLLTVPFDPHPAAALVGSLDPDGLRRRRETLRLLGTLPDAPRMLLVDAAVLVDDGWRGALAATGAALVLVDTSTAGPERRAELAAAAAALPQPAAALDSGCPIEDVAAAILTASTVVSATPALTAAALGAGVPVAAAPAGALDADHAGMARVPSPDALAAALQHTVKLVVDSDDLLARVDAGLDAVVAALPTAAAPARAAVPRRDERADQLAALRFELEAEVAALHAQSLRDGEAHAYEIRALEGEVARWRAETERLLGSRTYRWSEPARSAVRRLRGMGSRRP